MSRCPHRWVRSGAEPWRGHMGVCTLPDGRRSGTSSEVLGLDLQDSSGKQNTHRAGEGRPPMRARSTVRGLVGARRRRALVATAVLSVSALVASSAPTAADTTGTDEEEELAGTRRQAEADRAELAELEKSDSELVAELRELDSILDSLVLELDRAEADHDSARARLSVTRSRLAELRAEVSVVRGEFDRDVVGAYVKPAANLLSVPREPPDVVRTDTGRVLLGTLARARLEAARRLDSMATEIEALESQEADLVGLAARRLDDLEKRRAEVETARAERDESRRALASRMAEVRAEIEELGRREAELTELIRRQRESQEAARRAALLAQVATGKLGPNSMFPPTQGYVTSEFGPRWGRNHNGIDFGAPRGRDVVATAPGVVIHAGPFGSFGNLVMIDHGQGYVTLYAHMDSVKVHEGQTVVVGQRVGEVGSTGRSTGPHLHFEVRIDGVPRNPRRYLVGL